MHCTGTASWSKEWRIAKHTCVGPMGHGRNFMLPVQFALPLEQMNFQPATGSGKATRVLVVTSSFTSRKVFFSTNKAQFPLT